MPTEIMGSYKPPTKKPENLSTPSDEKSPGMSANTKINLMIISLFTFSLVCALLSYILQNM